jgi:short-subunit dehydrogenase
MQVNQTLEAGVRHLFFNIYVSPLIWIFLSVAYPYYSFLVFPVVKSICYTFAAISLYSCYKRRPKQIDWTKELVVITGGSNGIGKGLLQVLIQKGAQVINIDRIEPKENMGHYFQCDLSNAEAIKNVSEKVLKIGTPTVLVNNAGIVIGKTFENSTVEENELLFKVNVLAHFHLIKYLLPKMKEAKKGHIVGIASVMGQIGAAYAVDYCSSKFAVTGLYDSLRQEVMSSNISVSTVFPGLILTGMFDGVSHKNEWLTPPLSPETVVSAIAPVLENGYSAEVALPFYVRTTPLLWMLPLEVRDWFRAIIGANEDLRSFKGSRSQVQTSK